MAQKIAVALKVNDDQIAQKIKNGLNGLTNVQTLERYESGGDTTASPPDVIIIYAPSGIQGLSEYIFKLRQSLPKISVFVISADKSTDHVVAVMKAGADEFFANPLNVGRLQAAIEMVRQKLAALPSKAKGRLYSFISAKGGLGSTVISVNVAAALAMKSKDSTGLFDMSLQSGDSSVYLNTLPQTTLADICRNFQRLDFSFLKTSMLRHSTGLHYLAAPKDPEDSGSVHGAQVQKVLQLAKSMYDHVVVDCTSMLVDECSLEIFKASDRVFLLSDLSVPAIRNAARLNQLLLKLGIPPEKVEFVVNRFIKGGGSLVDVENTLKKKIYWLFPNDFDEVIESINAGLPLVKGKPGTAFARNVTQFAEKLKNPENYTNYRGVKGFLGKAI